MEGLKWSHWLEIFCVSDTSNTELRYLVPAQWHFVGFFHCHQNDSGFAEACLEEDLHPCMPAGV